MTTTFEKVRPPQGKFPLGQLVATPGAIEALTVAGQEPLFFLAKHVSGDWGDMDAEDLAANQQALLDGGRIFSAYRTLKGDKLWVITEAEDDHGNRQSTAILRPEEY